MPTRRAHAKINWSLAVCGRRADGYHLLDMLMQPIALHDTLDFSPASDISLAVEGPVSLPDDGENLVLRAARLLQSATGTAHGAAIRLHKKIPTGAGLGGGSADAAAALWGLCELWGLDISGKELAQLGLQLGADIPFCLTGGLARVRGIGEIIDPLPVAPAFPLVVIQPGQGLSTPAVFRKYDETVNTASSLSIDAVQEALLAGDASQLTATMGNDLQSVAIGMLPDIAACIAALESQGAKKAQMTGSGSAVIGLFDDVAIAEQATRHCAQRWPRVYLTATCRAESPRAPQPR